MNTTPTKYFVVSLPRTGTKSLCKMADMLGLKFCHAPTVQLPRMLNASDTTFFADTPLYAPSHIKHVMVNPNHKFIYMDRDVDEWKDSFERVGLHRNYATLLKLEKRNGYQELDKNCLAEVFDGPYDTNTAEAVFNKHKEDVFDLIPVDRLLVYKLSDGWAPFCKFLDKPIPTEEMPHINKNTMFEKL